MGSGPSLPQTEERRFEEDYILGTELGAGAFAKVYRCISKKDMMLQLAVKVVKCGTLDARMKRQLLEETRILTALHHPNIVKLYDVYKTKEQVHIVQELCEGGDLLDRMKEKGRYSEEDAKEVVKRLLDAVVYAHSSGVVHRDLKPENVLLTRKNNDIDIRLADWGVSRRITGQVMMTICGTPTFMAPEVLETALSKDGTLVGYDEGMDVWSVGVITYILLAGFNPFEGGLVPVTVHKVLNAEIEFPDRQFKGVSEEAKDFILCLLERDPDVRPTAAQCLEHSWLTQLTGNEGKTGQELKDERQEQPVDEEMVAAATNAMQLAEQLRDTPFAHIHCAPTESFTASSTSVSSSGGSLFGEIASKDDVGEKVDPPTEGAGAHHGTTVSRKKGDPDIATQPTEAVVSSSS